MCKFVLRLKLMQLLLNQNILYWPGGWVQRPNEKRVENHGVFGNNFKHVCNFFFNRYIDKARKTHEGEQPFLITHFTKQTLNLDYLLRA